VFSLLEKLVFKNHSFYFIVYGIHFASVQEQYLSKISQIPSQLLRGKALKAFGKNNN